MGRPNQLIRQFNSALARRVHLTGGKEGLRLMYWENDREIEFANVGVKHELYIAQGSPNGGTTIDLAELF